MNLSYQMVHTQQIFKINLRSQDRQKHKTLTNKLAKEILTPETNKLLQNTGKNINKDKYA